MKLLFITNNFPPISCGVGDYTYQLAKEFVINGHEVHIVCKNDQQIEQHWLKNKTGLFVHPIGGCWQKKDWQNVLKFIGEQEPTNILFQYVPSAYNRFAVPWHLIYFFKQLSKLKVNIITTFHETYVRYNWSNPKYLYVALGQRFIASKVAEKSDQLVTSIDRYEQQLKPWNTSVKVIPIGSNIPPIVVSTEEIATLKNKIAATSTTVICTFGNRNHGQLLKLFEKILALQPQLILLVIGKLNAKLNDMPKQVVDKIYVTGFLEATDVFKYLKASDAFIMLDRVRLNGNGGTCNKSGSLAAAFAAGLPIFATNGDMTNTLLREKSGITFISFLNLFKTASIIMEVLNHKENLKVKAQKASSFYENYLSFEKIAQDYNDILK